MTFKTLNRNNSKWPEVKIFCNLDLFFTKCIRITVPDRSMGNCLETELLGTGLGAKAGQG
jgi:hypothetical protein